MNEAFGTAAVEATLANCKQAMVKGQSMEDSTIFFLDTSAEMLGSYVEAGEVVSDEEIKRLIGEDTVESETSELDRRIDAEIRQLQAPLA